MILYIMSIRDRKIEAYSQPFFVPHVGLAIRSFTDAINGVKENDLSKHPEDFDLYHIGQFDDFSAVFESNVGGPRLVTTGKDCLKS